MKKYQIERINLIGIYIKDYEDTPLLVEKFTPIAYISEDVYSGIHKIEFYFYPIEMKALNFQFKSDPDMSRKAPVKKHLIADWTVK